MQVLVIDQNLETIAIELLNTQDKVTIYMWPDISDNNIHGSDIRKQIQKK